MNKTVSLETAKLLVEKGIVLETTEYCYAICAIQSSTEYGCGELVLMTHISKESKERIENYPAPDIPELLAELSNKDILDYVNQQEFFDQTMGEYINLLRNPDRLAQALIWVRSKAEVK